MAERESPRANKVEEKEQQKAAARVNEERERERERNREREKERESAGLQQQCPVSQLDNEGGAGSIM
jgi:hypothetical protein